MTEKRFVYYEHKGADYILDTPNTELDFIEMLGDALEPEEIVEKLNELVEENNGFKINEEFKNKAYSDLLDKFTQLKKKYQGIKKENKELKAENEQLKQEIKGLEKEIIALSNGEADWLIEERL